MGDNAGHPFRGNQYSDVKGMSDEEKVATLDQHYANVNEAFAKYGRDSAELREAKRAKETFEKHLRRAAAVEARKTATPTSNLDRQVRANERAANARSRAGFAARVEALELAVVAFARAEFGDHEGHPFRGNQWTFVMTDEGIMRSDKAEKKGLLEAPKSRGIKGMSKKEEKAIAKGLANGLFASVK